MNKTQNYFRREHDDFNSSYTDSKNIKDIVRRLAYFYNKKAIEGRLNALLKLVGEEIHEKKILEIGCGPGFYSIRLATKGAAVSALDYSEGMIQNASNNAKAQNVKIDFITGDFLKYEFQNKYDLSFATGVIEYIKKTDQLAFLKKTTEITNDFVIISFPKKYILHALVRQIWLFLFKGFSVSFFTDNKIKDLAKKSGLIEIERIDVGILWVIKFKKAY